MSHSEQDFRRAKRGTAHHLLLIVSLALEQIASPYLVWFVVGWLSNTLVILERSIALRTGRAGPSTSWRDPCRANRTVSLTSYSTCIPSWNPGSGPSSPTQWRHTVFLLTSRTNTSPRSRCARMPSSCTLVCTLGKNTAWKTQVS